MKHSLHTVLTLLFVCASAWGENVPWQNPQINEINREPAHAHFIPYTNEANALKQQALPAAQRFAVNPATERRISLDGTWKFLFSKNNEECPTDFYKMGYNTKRWKDIQVPGSWELQVIEKVRRYFGSNFRWSGLQQPGSRLFLRQRKRFLLRSPLKRRKLHTGTGMRSIHPLMDKSCHGRSGKSHAAPADRYSQVFYIHSLPHSGSRPSEVQSSWLLARSYLVGPDLLRYPRPAQLWI
jgi:hypothetical protein